MKKLLLNITPSIFCLIYLNISDSIKILEEQTKFFVELIISILTIIYLTLQIKKNIKNLKNEKVIINNNYSINN